LDYPDGVTKHGAVFNTDGQPIGLVKDTEYFATHRLSAQEKVSNQGVPTQFCQASSLATPHLGEFELVVPYFLCNQYFDVHM